MKTNNPWGVSLAAVAGLGTPDVVLIWADKFNAVAEVFVRLGQLGVAVMTIFYIYRKWKSVEKRGK